MPLTQIQLQAALLGAVVLITGCATSTRDTAPTTVPTASSNSNPELGGRAIKGTLADLAPAQVLTPQAQGMRVRWSGGINAVQPQEGGRQCFTMLQATFSAEGTLQWPADAQNFVACGAGSYDPDLVAQFTLVSFEGKVAGQKNLGGKPVPVIEITTLYRHSDCVQGSDHIPACYSGYLQPLKKH